MRVEDEVLNALVQVFTRSKASGVSLKVSDSLPIPPYSLPISETEFISYIGRSDLSTLSLKALVDLSSVYFQKLEHVLNAEFGRRKSLDPDFSKKLVTEVTPRLREPKNPTRRYSE